MDPYPGLPIRDQFNGLHKELVIIGYDGQEIDRVTLSSGVNNYMSNLVTGIIADNYVQFIPGDINDDGIVNVLDVIQTVNMVLNTSPATEFADMNADGLVNVVDIILIVNIILNP